MSAAYNCHQEKSSAPLSVGAHVEPHERRPELLREDNFFFHQGMVDENRFVSEMKLIHERTDEQTWD